MRDRVCALRIVAAFASSISFIASPVAHATPGQPGTLDATWATSSPLGAGKVMTPIGSSAIAYAIALQADGKVLLTGGCGVNGTDVDFCTLRYLANGTLDPSFGSAGIATTAIGGSDDLGTAIALQTDDKVLIAGICQNGSNFDFCALRYHTDGTLDASFGSGGKVVTAIGSGGDLVTAMAVQPDGRILLAGWCSNGTNGDFCALRYLANGTLDASFGSGGKVVTSIGNADDIANAIALQPDSKIVLAGQCQMASNDDFCALRYLANGTLDASFGVGGKVSTAIGSGSDRAYALALQPDGKALLAGACANGTIDIFCALRYRADGALDTSWSGDGKLFAVIGGGDNIARAIALQPDGKVLLAGFCHNGTHFDFCAARHHADGTRDGNFGTNSNVATTIGSGNDQAYAIALQPDGKILLAGHCANASGASFCALRYDGGPFGYQNCKLDLDGDGKVLPTTDLLIGTRVSLGMTGSSVIGGIAFASHATRTTWVALREYFVTQCGMTIP